MGKWYSCLAQYLNFAFLILIRSAGLGWHADNELIHGSTAEPFAILSLSLGSTRTFLIQKSVSSGDDNPIIDVPMRSGDLLVMNGLFLKEFKHK